MATCIRSFALTKFIHRHSIAPSTAKKLGKLLNTLDISATALFIRNKEVFAFDGLVVWNVDAQAEMFTEPPRKNPILNYMQLEKFKARVHKRWLLKWGDTDKETYEKRISLEKRRIAGVRQRVIVR